MGELIAWSDDPEDSGLIESKPKPLTVLPHCGSSDVEKDFDKVKVRYCCRCGKGWSCTGTEWINGTCPNCGASGTTGNGSSIQTNVARYVEKPQNNDHPRIVKHTSLINNNPFEFIKNKELKITEVTTLNSKILNFGNTKTLNDFSSYNK